MAALLLDAHTTESTVRQVSEMLRAGKLVVLPTETVYGIAVNLLSPARARLKALKQLPDNPHWVIHVPSGDHALERYLPDLPPVGRRLVQKCWPGPVALQVQPSAREHTLLQALLGDALAEIWVENMPHSAPSYTLRCPDFFVTQEILAAAGVPVAIIGANPSGMEQATDAAGVVEAVRENVDAVVDGGPTRYRKPSTLVRLDAEGLKVLRPGVIDERILYRLTDMVILFVCSGNTCRSPMAAGIAAMMIAEKLGTTPADVLGKSAKPAGSKAGEKPGAGVLVMSAGVHASRGMRATLEAVQAAKELGADLGAHLSQPATIDVLRRADVIYTMTAAHLEEVVSILPSAAKKTHRLDPQGDIDDPIGADSRTYRQVAGHLQEVIRMRLKEILP